MRLIEKRKKLSEDPQVTIKNAVVSNLVQLVPAFPLPIPTLIRLTSRTRTTTTQSPIRYGHFHPSGNEKS